MNTQDFLEILHNPTKLKDEHAFDIEYIIKSFPYFQAARVLHLKSLKNQNSFHYNQSLKTTAAYTTDRHVLFDFITSEEFLLNPSIKKTTSEFIEEIELVDETVIKNLKNDVSKKSDKKRLKKEVITQEIEDESPTEIDTNEKELTRAQIAENSIEKEHDFLSEKENLSAENNLGKEKKKSFHKLAFLPPENTDGIKVFIETIEQNKEALEHPIPLQYKITEKEKTSTKPSFIASLKQKKENNISEINNDISAIVNLPNVDTKEDLIESEEEKEIIKEKEHVNFNKDDSFSFNQWLQLSSFKPINRNTNSINKKMELIDKFIEKKPKIKPTKKEKTSSDFTPIKIEDSSTPMTETLARVYTNQKKYLSAIKAYEVLSLKFPEKSGFFADQIKMLKKLKQKIEQ